MKFVLGVMCFALFAVMGISSGFAGDDIKIFTENYPPFNYEENGKLAGLSVEIVSEIQKRIGDDNKIVMSPWNRAYQLCQKQKNVALFSMTRTEKREGLFKWVGPLADNNWVVVAARGKNIKVSELADLKKYKIGTYLNDAAELFLKDNGLGTQINSVNDDRLNAKKLIAGRIDLWIGGKMQLPFKAKQVGVDPKNLEVVFDVKKTSLYLAFNKGTNDAVIAKWQKALDDMKKDGTYDRIIKKYN